MLVSEFMEWLRHECDEDEWDMCEILFQGHVIVKPPFKESPADNHREITTQSNVRSITHG